jgi:tRNA-dihydrouridine synthase B
VRALPGGEAFRTRMNAIEDAQGQLRAVADYFDGLAQDHDRLPAADTVVRITEEEQEA